jgi:hybrid cluster-associated redox disulfide protein
MKKIKQYITENTMISEIVEKYPEVAEVLTMDYGFHCMGCFGADMETIGQGAGGHGMTDEEIKDMLITVNGLIEDAKAQSDK